MRVLRGRGFQFMGRQFHTTSVVTGLLIAGIGVLFWITNGLVTAPTLVPATAQRWLQSSSSILANPLFDAILLAALVIVLVTAWAIRRTRKQLEDTNQYATESHCPFRCSATPVTHRCPGGGSCDTSWL